MSCYKKIVALCLCVLLTSSTFVASQGRKGHNGGHGGLEALLAAGVIAHILKDGGGGGQHHHHHGSYEAHGRHAYGMPMHAPMAMHAPMPMHFPMQMHSPMQMHAPMAMHAPMPYAYLVPFGY